MQYISTRGGAEPQSFREILLSGMMEDGGLAIPEIYPWLTPAELTVMRGMSYQDLAFAILSRFIDDIPLDDLRRLIDCTYTAETFGSKEITPLKKLGWNVSVLGLSNGPTLAFKDIAMQLLGKLFEYQLEETGEELNILGATSGDTGSSAEYAMLGKRGIRVFMLSPLGRMSPFQTAQMFSLQNPNIFNVAVRGVFDDCQDIVKAVSNDLPFKTRYNIGTVNSINWARILGQVVYWFKGFFAASEANTQYVDFAVPTGNFGNACAGHIARSMGLPIRRIIVATNENNVLDEFFSTGVYRVRPPQQVMQTSSPSMDISKASNFERFVYKLVCCNPEVVKSLWWQLDSDGMFDLSGTQYFGRMKYFGFVSGSSTHSDRIETIRNVRGATGHIIDPHTADGVKIGLENREGHIPLVCLETALPAKFAGTIQEALGLEPERPPGYENLEELPQRFELMNPDVQAVKDFIAEHCD